MDKINFILDLVKKIRNPVAKIVFIILILIATGISIFFTGCAYKMQSYII